MNAWLGLCLGLALAWANDEPVEPSAALPESRWQRPAVEPLQVPPFPQPTAHQLSDGTPVWIIEQGTLPLVRMELSLRTGWVGAPDPLAARMAGVLLKDGPRDQASSEWALALAGLGATVSLGVNAQRSWVDIDAISGTEEAALALASRALLEPAFRRSDVRRLRRLWVQQHKTSWRTGWALRSRALNMAVYPPDHPLRQLWSLRDLRRLRPRRVKRAWTWVLSEGAPCLLVVGDVETEPTLVLLEEAWADRFPGSLTPQPLPAPPAAGPRLVLVDHPGSAQVLLTLSLPAPAAYTPQLLPAELVDHVFASAFTSRLNSLLREDLGLVYGVGSTIRAWPGHGRLEISMVVGPEDLTRCLDAIHQALWQLSMSPPDERETRGARNAQLLSSALSLGSLQSMAYHYGLLQLHGQPPSAALERAMSIQEIEPKDLASSTAEVFETNDILWLIVGDRELLEVPLEQGGWPPDTIWSRDWVIRGDHP